MSLRQAPTRLNYAIPHRVAIAPWFIKRHWIWFSCGLAGFIVGLLYEIHLDAQPRMEVHWVQDALAAVLLFGGVALCLAGIVCAAITAWRTG